ncbi:MAG: hypothetical protein C0501_18995 [Isosphaera sp.]|nr:hypothetical protein [Isosphaera sp.]
MRSVPMQRQYATFRRWVAALVCLGFGAGPGAAADEPFERAVAPFLKQHCSACHGAKKQEAGVRFDQVDGMNAGNRNLWTMVHGQLSSGEMSPKGTPQPADADRKKVLTWVADRQRALGAGGTRRLNRRELAAALRDATGLAVDFVQALPGDGTVAGFDTGADGLTEASDAVAQWLVVTRRAVDGIGFLDVPKGKTFSADLRESKDPRKAFDAWKADGGQARGSNVPRPGAGLLLEARAVGDRDEMVFVVPPPERRGVLRLSLAVSAMKPVAGIPNPRLWVRVGGLDIDFREVTGMPDKPQHLVYQVHLGDLAIPSKGLTVSLGSKVEIPYAVKGFENEDHSRNDQPPVPGGTGLFRPAFDRRAVPLDEQPVPFVVLQRVEIEPDVVAAWPPAGWKAAVGEIKDDTDSAKRLLALWTERAWRRPASDAERAPFVKLYEKLRADGRSFDDALRAAFQSVLMSAPFRYLASPAHPDAAVAQHAVASRLSFMLWGAPPDAELRALAKAGQLRDPKALDAQVDRLLADPRSDGFVRPFVVQWLEMEQPITIAQDHSQKQDFRFARYMKVSMRDETISYVAQLLKDNRPAGELVHSDWTMMNDALARHYGYDGVEGGEMRKVKLRATDPRGGGILGHAGIQSMLTWMGDNWVIYRGAWALRHILDLPPPPPPLEVPELNPSEGKNRGKPFRELLKQHQEDARCAVCHKHMDPVGFAFQNFDLSGRWRDVEHEGYKRGGLDGVIVWAGEGSTRPVDATGNLPRGEAFKTFAEFKGLLAKHYRDDLTRGLMKNLFVYGTGRVPGIDDTAEIAAIMKGLKPKDYPLRDLLKAVVRSRAFLEQYDLVIPPQPPAHRKP